MAESNEHGNGFGNGAGSNGHGNGHRVPFHDRDFNPLGSGWTTAKDGDDVFDEFVCTSRDEGKCGALAAECIGTLERALDHDPEAKGLNATYKRKLCLLTQAIIHVLLQDDPRFKGCGRYGVSFGWGAEGEDLRGLVIRFDDGETVFEDYERNYGDTATKLKPEDEKLSTPLLSAAAYLENWVTKAMEILPDPVDRVENLTCIATIAKARPRSQQSSKLVQNSWRGFRETEVIVGFTLEQIEKETGRPLQLGIISSSDFDRVLEDEGLDN